MVFKSVNELVFVNVQTLRASKTGKEFHIVKLADPITYDNVEFFPKDVNDWNTLKQGQKVKASVEFNGRYNSLVREMA